MNNSPTYFPPQKVSTTLRSRDWFIKCVKAAESLALSQDNFNNQHRKMQVWENLDKGIIDEKEIERVFNPMKIENATFPAALKNYPLCVPKIDLLQGEEIKRKFDWNIIAKNDDSASWYTQLLKDEIINLVVQEIHSQSSSEEEIQAKIAQIQKYYAYEFKDMNEVTAIKTLQYFWKEQTLKAKFSEGFRDALVKGREIYRIDVAGGEPIVELVDAKNLFPIRRGKSHKIEEADIIVELCYDPIGKVIDEFHDYLKPGDVSELESGFNNGETSPSSGVLNHVNGFPLMLMSTNIGGTNELAPIVEPIGYGLPYDLEGNVKVVRARWLGRKKIGRLTFFDPQTGNEKERLVSEFYIPKEDMGESVKWFWVNEAMEGTCIADKYYVKLQPREVQMRHFDNPSKCFLGYVGTDYGRSMMESMESYQYLYNVYMRRLELAIAKYKGPIYPLDTARKPSDWSTEMWMYYAEILGWAIEDSFNEGTEGAATGKMIGGLNNTSGKTVLNADSGSYIQQLVSMLQYIEQQLGRISGVTDQREGQIDNRETVGGVERSVTQSSHITERWFFIHDETKKRVLEALLNTAKQSWRDTKSKRLAFIHDDLSRQVIEFSGEDFASSEYDLFITNSSDDMEIRQLLKGLSQAAVQNGASLSLPVKVLRSDSISEMSKIIEADEATRIEREQQTANNKIQSDQAISQAMLEDKQKDRDLEYYKIDTTASTAIQVALMKMEQQPTTIEEPNDALEQQKLALQERKQQLDGNINNMKIVLEKGKLDETVRHNQATETIQRNKPKTTKS